LLAAAVAAVLMTGGTALAQQPAPEQQRQDDVPTLTTDDITPPQVATASDGDEAQPAEDPDMTPEEKADADAGKKTAAGAKAGAKKQNPAEVDWRRRYAAAQARVRKANEAAQEAELKVTDLRNRLGQSGSVEERRALVAELDQQGDVVTRTKQEAQAAATALSALQQEGASKKYSATPGPSATTKGGQANPNYYAQKYADAQQRLADANRRVQLYQNRLTEGRSRQLNEGGSGDQFAQFKIQGDIDDAQKQLDKATADRDAAQRDLDAVRKAARDANVDLPRE
jgi:hypothetical protein